MTASLPLVTPELALRIQKADIAGTWSRMSGIQSVEGNRLSVAIQSFGGIACFKSGNPDTPIPNLLLGVTTDELDNLDAALDWLGTSFVIAGIVPLLAGEEVLSRLAVRGLVHSSFMTVTYGLPLADQPALHPNITIQCFTGTESETFARYVVEIDGITEPDRPSWTRLRKGEFRGWWGYVAFVDGVPAARAAMGLGDGIARLGFGYTDPRYRGRGCQTALLSRRMADAATEGCDLIVSGSVPGTISERNQLRAGLHIAYTRANWTPLGMPYPGGAH